MNIALIGYGKMGHAIERIAVGRGHHIGCRIDQDNQHDFDSPDFAAADIAIEFTTPATAVDNIRRSLDRGVSVVSGTTGWHNRLDEMKAYAEHSGRGLFWTSNFSIGVNILFDINRRLAELMNRYPQYDASLKEIHHIHKLDAPSGTAVSLANDIVNAIERLDTWQLDTHAGHTLTITAERTGEVPGTHIVTYNSPVDTLTIAHEAKSRDGFALGAVMAAEYMRSRTGFHTMSDLINNQA